MTPPLYHLWPGDAPLLIDVPHAGTFIPDEIASRLTPIGRAVVDTDWHVDRLYEFARELGVTLMAATHSRTVADLNRGPEGTKLYPGQVETGILPAESFAGEALYPETPPDAVEIAARVERYWLPYHARLEAEIGRIREQHGRAIVIDGHSILGEIPRLFAGALPDLNFGTHDGASSDPALARLAVEAAEGQGFSTVLNGRFKGGYITRHYGRPDDGVHVIQLEMAQRCYMEEGAPGPFDGERAAPLIGVLRRVVGALLHA